MPTDIALSRFQDLDAIELTTSEGASATLLIHGGQVVSWKPVGATEQLYLSPRSGFAPGQAIRGGVPVIFPQFNARGPLQRHGFARNKMWEFNSATHEADGAQAVLRLQDDDATRASWPHRFVLELRVSIQGSTLEVALACMNAGDTPLNFTSALHTYLRLADLRATSVQGLERLRYWDAVADTTQAQDDEWLHPAGDLDRVYYGVNRNLLLVEKRQGADRRLSIDQEGFEDAVVWNPDATKCAALADMPPDGYRNMLCIEAAQINRPVQLAPGERWVAVQKLTLL